jgi:hypothetical protein
MDGGISKEQTRRSRAELPNALLLDAVALAGAGMRLDVFEEYTRDAGSSATELPPSHTEQSPVSGTRDAPVQSTKRRLEGASESDPSPVKRVRFTQTDTQQPGVEGEEAGEADKV